MIRLNFTRKTKAQAFARCGGNCEGCGARLVPGHFQYDHIREANDDGGNGLDNCQVLCTACHTPKTVKYVQETRKAERARDKHIGAMMESGRKLSGPGFHRAPPQRRASKPLAKWYGVRDD